MKTENEDTLKLAQIIGRILEKYQKTVSVAESCTGGYLSHIITSIPGSSGWYKGGIIAYSNEVKEELLFVDPEIIKNHGAVSQETIKAMTEGCVKRMQSDFAIATSGIAGPGGDSEEKPVGTIWIAAGNKKNCLTDCLHLGGNRIQNIRDATFAALKLLKRLVEFKEFEQPKGKG